MIIKCKWLHYLYFNHNVTLGELVAVSGYKSFRSHPVWYTFMYMLKKKWIVRVRVGSHGVAHDQTIVRLTKLGLDKTPNVEVQILIMRHMRNSYVNGRTFVHVGDLAVAAGYKCPGSTGFYYSKIQLIFRKKWLRKYGAYYYLTTNGKNFLGL